MQVLVINMPSCVHASKGGRVSVPTITDPRGVDLNYYSPLGQTEAMADLDRRTIAACTQLGMLMTNTCI
ncbi:MAG: aconitase X, partial [Pseudomonadota bacterium]